MTFIGNEKSITLSWNGADKVFATVVSKTKRGRIVFPCSCDATLPRLPNS